LVFPLLVAVASALLLTHSHSLGNSKEEVLAELSHAPLAILGITAACSRWLELRLPADNRARHALAGLWPVCFLLRNPCASFRRQALAAEPTPRHAVSYVPALLSSPP
jgi:hypothetical protein